MNDRITAIRILAWSLYDLSPTPETASGKMLRRALVAKSLEGTKKVPCPSCSKPGETFKGSGYVVDHGRQSPCQRCGGYVDEKGKPIAGSGRLAYDPYDAQKQLRRVGTDDKPVAPPQKPTYALEFHDDPDRVDRAGDVLDQWQDAIDKRNQDGSYHELEQCLAEMYRKSPHWWRVFWPVRVTGTVSAEDLGGLDSARLMSAEQWLAFEMPALIRVPAGVRFAWEHRDDKNRQPRKWLGAEAHRSSVDAEVLRRYAAGEPVAVIAGALGISARSVYRAIERAEEAA